MRHDDGQRVRISQHIRPAGIGLALPRRDNCHCFTSPVRLRPPAPVCSPCLALMAPAPLGASPRPYRDFLTPALHRRFNKASRYTLVLCYATAVWMAEWDSSTCRCPPARPSCRH